MARNRQRAKDRKARQHQHIHREDVPGELEHIGEIDEVEASIVAGADGEQSDVDEAELEREAIADAPPTPARRESSDRTAPSGPRPGGNRVVNFLRASWAELQRVQWPDRRQVAQATAVVLGFVAIAGAYLGLADSVAQKIVNFIL
jgi:preprotein translocase subunit SecE